MPTRRRPMVPPDCVRRKLSGSAALLRLPGARNPTGLHTLSEATQPELPVRVCFGPEAAQGASDPGKTWSVPDYLLPQTLHAGSFFIRTLRHSAFFASRI